MSVVPRDPFELLPADWREQLEEKWPDGARLTWAWRLARDLDACADLIAGRAVDPSRLDPSQLRLANEARLVVLVRPVDLLEVAA